MNPYDRRPWYAWPNSMKTDRANGAAQRGASAAVALAVTAVLGAVVQSGATSALDAAVHRAMSRRRTPRIVRVATAVSVPADPRINWLFAIAASVVVHRRRGRRLPAPLMALLVELGLNRVARLFVQQPRPAGARRRLGRDRFAYPSGHTAATAAIAYATALELTDGSTAEELMFALALASAGVALVGWSRLELEEHWVNNIVGGWIMGAGSALVATAIRMMEHDAGPTGVRRLFCWGPTL